MMRELVIVRQAPFVRVVGVTQPVVAGFNDYLAYRDVAWNTDPIADDPEAIIEAAGRVCYQSWHNPANKSRQAYLQGSIISHLHGSCLEHLWVNCLVADVPRSVQLELVRHGEGTAFSFESQRFTDKHLRFVMPPLVRGDRVAEALFIEECQSTMRAYEAALTAGMDRIERDDLFGDDRTLRRKRAKEAARSVLGNNVGSDGMFSVNARGARHIIAMRSDEHADASIREFAVAVFDQIQSYLDGVMADAQRVPVEFGPEQIVFQHRKV